MTGKQLPSWLPSRSFSLVVATLLPLAAVVVQWSSILVGPDWASTRAHSQSVESTFGDAPISKRQWWDGWEGVDWAKHGTRRKLQPRLPRADQRIRDLEWGDVQFLHTTDIHGWYTGHHSPFAPATSYSADWADWVSFITRMKAKAHSEGRDLVVVDTGDLVTGHGISDAHPSAPPGHFSNQIFKMADYDIATIGNHELYAMEGVHDIRANFIPTWKGNYLTSNVNISATGRPGESQPIGSLWTSTVLPQTGLRVTSLGILFDFKAPHEEIIVQPPLQMLEMPWLKELVKSPVAAETDIWLLAGHMPLDGPEDDWDAFISGLRRWTNVGQKSIVALGGHTHLRNCRQMDNETIILQSGRFHETAGWVSLRSHEQVEQVDEADTSQARLRKPYFSRRYIDLNPRNLAHHASVSLTNLTTPFGHFVRHVVQSLISEWGLDTVHGFSPQDWYLERFPAENESSILRGTSAVLERLFEFSTNNDTEQDMFSKPANLVILNSGSLRSDLRRGPFTTNDQFIVSPFSDTFHVIPAVPYRLASQVLAFLNTNSNAFCKAGEAEEQADAQDTWSTLAFDAGEEFGKCPVLPYGDVICPREPPKEHPWLVSAQKAESLSEEQADEEDLSLNDGTYRESDSEGYVTYDSCGATGHDGDDTIHRPIPVVPFEPPYLGILTGPRQKTPADDQTRETSPATADVVTVKYLLPRVLAVLNHLEKVTHKTRDGAEVAHEKWTLADSREYVDSTGRKLRTRDIWQRQASEVWSQRLRLMSGDSAGGTAGTNGDSEEQLRYWTWEEEWEALQSEADALGFERYDATSATS